MIETKTLDRPDQPVIIKGGLADFLNVASVNNADVTQSPNQIFVWAYDEGTGWRQVVFQIDEINNTYPAAPPPDMGCGRQRGPNYYGINNVTSGQTWDPLTADDDLWDSNDELVFMCSETGDRVSQDEWAPGASITAVRYEIAIADPLDALKKGWVYVFLHDTLPSWRTDDYVSWTESSNTVTATNYNVVYNSTDSRAAYFSTLRVSAAGGGTNTDLVATSKLKWYGGAGTKFTNNEGDFRTQFNMEATTSCPLTWSLPWFNKDGRVRVLRYYIWMPYNLFYAPTGVGFRPDTHIRYYKNLWHEESYPVRHGGNYFTDYWEDSINHANTTTMAFYDSNGENCTIDGTSETLAATPLWTWYQVSSSYGSYIKLFRDTQYVTADKYNIYTDSGSTRGQGGIHFTDPSESQSSSNKNQFYYFFLPANAVNLGETYDNYIDSPLATTSSEQAYVASPPEFAGIQSVVDVGGACADEGVLVSWDGVTNWNDGCSSNCTNRRFEVSRDGSVVQTVTDTATTSWTDITANNNVDYDYGVEACNNNDTCTELGNTLEGTDHVHSAPTLNGSATTAADISGCTGEGLNISWSSPSDWGDNGEGTRSYALYSSADGYASPIATPAASPYVHDAENGVGLQYRMRATNGCGDFTNYSASAAVADAVGAVPTLADPTLTVSDIDCSLTGILLQWNPVVSWNDNGEGAARYDLYRSDNYSTLVMSNVSSPLTYQPGNSNPYSYRIVAMNGCGMTSAYTDSVSIADAQSAPAFAGVQGVADTDGCSDSTLTISWADVEGDGPTGWNDGGSGPFTRYYHIFRSGVEITGSPVADGITSITDNPPLTDTFYTYTVRAYNMNGCWTDGGASISGADYVGMSPVSAPAQTTAADITCDAATGVTVTWDPVTDWGDGGTNSANRRYRLYFSRDGFTNIIKSGNASTGSFTYKPVDRGAYIYRIVAVNGCNRTTLYADSAATADLSSCAPTCTLLLNNDFDPSNGFTEACNGGRSMWSVTTGAGNGGSSAWVCDLDATADWTSSIEMTTASTLIWRTDVKLRFWSSCSLSSDDAGVVEVYTNDSGLWRKIVLLPYPSVEAEVPSSIEDNCQSGTLAGTQPAFQESAAGGYYEARLDDYITVSTTQLKVRFRAASGSTTGTSSWVIDDVKLGYGITDNIYFWSLDGNPEIGVIKDGADGYGNEGIFRWEDGGIYQTSEFRIYRSENPANIRTDATSVLAWTEPDDDDPYYEYLTSDGVMAVPVYFYKVYGYKDPCGESDQGEN